MSMLSHEAALFIAGIILGMLQTLLVFVPIFYGFLRSLVWVFRGWARSYAPLLYLMRPLVWGLALVGPWLGLLFYGPDMAKNLLWSPHFALGQLTGLIIVLGRGVLSKYARDRRREKFLKAMIPHLTDVGRANVIMRGLIDRSR